MPQTESSVERLPVRGLAGVIRTVWIQRTGAEEHVHRHLPSGGAEILFPLGGRPQLLGPSTRATLEVIPAHTTLVGVRFHPGAAPLLPDGLDALVDQRVYLTDLRRDLADRLVDEVGRTTTPETALQSLQAQLLNEFRASEHLDPLVHEAVRALMPWSRTSVDRVATYLSLSPSQLRRRCLQAVGMTPKVLQRTLRFQGFLALAQAAARQTGQRAADGLAGLALEAGYADQAHLARECLRLAGLTPRQLLDVNADRCAQDHDHSGSYRPFLAPQDLALPRV
ncbi:MAG TPA: DUF6597 domain-containing transcriptional factor [Kribbella sp.]